MSENSYTLINPYIEGEFKKNIKAKNSAVAAQLFHESLSEHFNNSVPKFHFTIQKGGSSKGKLYHFQVKENRNEDEVTFSMKPYVVNSTSNIDNFNKNLKTFKNKF